MEHIIADSRSGKAPGIDGLINEAFKNTASTKVLTVLFNPCLHKHLQPSVWSRGIISPIPKTKDNNPHELLNYRGISLLSVVSKLYTTAISSHISTYLEINDKLANEQNGFRDKRSCLDHIYTLYNICKIWEKLRTNTFFCLIDFQKAVDFVNHDLLYNKQINIGITGDLYHLIKNIYSRPSSCVQLGGQLKDWFPVTSGVRQGDLISPTLFAVFINDLAQEINSAKMQNKHQWTTTQHLNVCRRFGLSRSR